MLSWKAPEFEMHSRGPIWKVVMALIIAGLIVWGILSQNWIFPVLVIAAAFAYYSLHREEPKEIKISIAKDGVHAGDRFYPFSKIKAFWILYDPPYLQKMMIRVSGDLLYDIPLLMSEDLNQGELRELMSKQVPELKNKQEGVGDALLRLLRI